TAVPGALVIGEPSGNVSAAVIDESSEQISNNSVVTIHFNGQLLLQGMIETIGSLTMTGGQVDTMAGLLTFNRNLYIPSNDNNQAPDVYGRLSLGGVTRSVNLSGGNATQFVLAADVINGGGNPDLIFNADSPEATVYFQGDNLKGGFTGNFVLNQGMVFFLGQDPTSTVSVNPGGLLTLGGAVGDVTVNGGAFNARY